MSLSDLARATGALPGAREAAPATPAEQAERSARAEMARALATLSEPVRALASFTRAELTRGTALLRARVLRSGLGTARELRRSQMNDLSEGLGGLAPSQRYAASLRSESFVDEQTDAPWGAFVLLTRSDRTLLSLLYVSAQTEGADLSRVDDVARALLALRQREQAVRNPDAERHASLLQLAAPRLPGGVGASAMPGPYEPASSAESESERASQAPWRSNAESFTSLSFGNAAGFAARAVSSYRSLLPPASATTSLPPPSATDDTTTPTQANETSSSAVLTRAFSAAQALGVSSLIDSLTRNLQTTRRKPRKQKPRARELDAPTTDQDADRDARRRARWHLLFRQRRAQRRATRR